MTSKYSNDYFLLRRNGGHRAHGVFLTSIV